MKIFVIAYLALKNTLNMKHVQHVNIHKHVNVKWAYRLQVKVKIIDNIRTELQLIMY